MADDSATFVKMQQQMSQLLNQNAIAITKMNTMLDDTLDTFEGMNKNIIEMDKGFERTSKTVKTKFFPSIRDIGRELAQNVMKPFLAIFSAGQIINTTTAMMKHQMAVKDLSLRMGEAGKSVGALNDAMFKVANNAGISTEKSLEFITALKETRVATKDLTALATSAAQFARITGVADANAARLTAELMRSGKIGKTATQDILAGMVKVQRVFGMSRGEMEQLTDTVIETSRVLGQMGKSAGEITKFTTGVGKLAGAFSSVGVSTEKAQKFIDELLDPDKIQDNALLYAKLGISMRDALSGNVDPGMLADKFKNLGQQLKGMSNVAAGQLAKQMGMSLRDLRAMADIPPDKLNKTLGAAGKGAEDLNVAFEEQKSAQDHFIEAWNKVQTGLESFATKTFYPLIEKFSKMLTDPKMWIILGVLAAGAILLIRKKFLGVAVDFGEAIKTATTGALGMASQKAAVVAETAKGGGGGRFMGPAATTRTAANIGTVTDKLTTLNAETTVMREQLNISLQDLNTRKEILDKRQIELKGLPISAEHERESVMNAREINRINEAANPMAKERNRLLDVQDKMSEKYIRLMGKEAQAAMHDQLQGQLKINEASQSAVLAKIREGELNQKAAKQTLEAYTEERNRLRTIVDSKDATLGQRREYDEMVSLVNKLKGDNEAITQDLKLQDSVLNEQMEAEKKIRKTVEQIEHINKDIASVDIGAKNVSGIHKLSQFVKSEFSKAGAVFVDKLHKAGEGIRKALSPANIKATAKKVGTGLAKGLGKLTLIMGLVMTLLGPILKKMQPIFDKLTAQLAPIIEILANALMPIFDALMPLVKVLIKVLLPPLLKLLGFLLIVIGYLITALGYVAGVFSKKVGDELKNFGKSIRDAGSNMITASGNIVTAMDKKSNEELLAAKQDELVVLQKKVAPAEAKLAEFAAAHPESKKWTTVELTDFLKLSKSVQDAGGNRIGPLEKEIAELQNKINPPLPKGGEVGVAETGVGAIYSGAAGGAKLVSGTKAVYLTAEQMAKETNDATATTATNTSTQITILTDMLNAIRILVAGTSVGGAAPGQASKNYTVGGNKGALVE
jgi:hypothetical protein